MATNLQVENAVSETAQPVKDELGNPTSLSLSTDKVGIGTTNPTQLLTLGLGNISLSDARLGQHGNLYFGGVTDAGQIGMRLYGGNVNGHIPSGFIDVRAGTLTDGLIFRVDNSSAHEERMRITASGNVGIGVTEPRTALHVRGRIAAGSHQESAGALTLLSSDLGTPFHIDNGPQAGGRTIARLRISGGENPGDAEFVSVQQDGNVGIGTTEPKEKLEVNGNIVTNGDIRLTNADCAEEFDICDTEQIEPGTVMVLGEKGKLEQTQKAYDKRVAGVVSGAGDYKPGIVLDKQEFSTSRKPIALLGKAFCKVDAGHGAIEIGDLLTSSPTLGHAMKASDPLKAFGAVIGKALRPLTEGQGLIPILIALQ